MILGNLYHQLHELIFFNAYKRKTLFWRCMCSFSNQSSIKTQEDRSSDFKEHPRLLLMSVVKPSYLEELVEELLFPLSKFSVNSFSISIDIGSFFAILSIIQGL